ncbi:hypothetical protein D348_00629 [Enterococcus faecalis SLO2C-1]|nr:hypothetical protein D348_00629 [Enterococcus faecalis SLO2C-1]
MLFFSVAFSNLAKKSLLFFNLDKEFFSRKKICSILFFICFHIFSKQRKHNI